jgi:hypothetical protein
VYSKDRSFTKASADFYVPAQTAYKLSALKNAYAHTRQAFGGIEWFKEAGRDEVFVHSFAVIFNFY